MANKMLIDASHPEETRVVVVKGNRVEEFDFESEHKKQIKGNIYLAKVTRVEPSLQAAFVEYGGNRHGFLAFSEIHPDYYQIPVADRQALIEDELARAAEEEEEDEKPAKSKPSRGRRRGAPKAAEAEAGDSVSETVEAQDADEDADEGAEEETEVSDEIETDAENESDEDGAEVSGEAGSEENGERRNRRRRRSRDIVTETAVDEEAEQVDEVGTHDSLEEVPTRSTRPPRKQYKIQEVIKRRQIILVQVVKEERGNKGAALTTYLSLAGRYSVLMPNTARGGGISRKITNVADRKRLKEVARELEVPKGMGIILRTAGANRTKQEVKRDYEYLMRMWETVRTLTLESVSPALVYEEGSLIKRSIRDLYNKDIDQVLVSGEAGYREAKDFMRMLMPSQAKVVQPYRDPVPMFARQGIEAQLDKMLQPNVTLKSGGYIIINQTEALVSIDVNSGRSTREHSIEDTAYQTNLEAAEEVARQLRLRDLAGLVVIDFIDMEEKRNNRAVEKKLKDCLKDDRARIQIGRISHFGLLEMSRQRIRASVLESTMQTCPVCSGNGFIRSNSSLALHVVRSIEEHLQKHGTHDLVVRVPTATALYVLNEKRGTIDELERHYGLRILLEAVEGHGHQHISIEHGAEVTPRPRPEPVQPLSVAAADVVEIDDIDADESVETETEMEPEADGELVSADTRSDGETERRDGGRRRRRRRRGGRREEGSTEGVEASEGSEPEDEAPESASEAADGTDDQVEVVDHEGERKRRRRGRRGGRRTREDGAHDAPVMDVAGGAGADEETTVMSANETIDIGSDRGDEAPVEVGDVAARSPDPEMTDAVDAINGVDLDGGSLADLEADASVQFADENEIIADSAEAGALIDGNPPLDEVFPNEEDATSFADDNIQADVAAARDQPDSATAMPRASSVGSAANESDDAKPKRTGWWSKRGTA